GAYASVGAGGVYRCRACGAELFRSGEKFESHCGWPSFYQPSSDDAVVLIEDRSLGTMRTEVRCASCDSHLGHVFEGEGYPVPTDQRWCINSISLTLEPADGEGAAAAAGGTAPPRSRACPHRSPACRATARIYGARPRLSATRVIRTRAARGMRQRCG